MAGRWYAWIWVAALVGCGIARHGLGRDGGAASDGPHPATDSGALLDAGRDGSGPLDGGVPADAGVREDGGVTRDGGAGEDAAPAVDAGPPCTPGEEVCNALDDDCDTLVDEEGCDCTRGTVGSSVYLFCDDTGTWSEARTICQGWGYDLVVIDDRPENDFVASQAAFLATDVWIGLSDRATEGTYRWVDGRVAYEGGTERLFTRWRPSDAPRENGSYDCTELDPLDAGYWLDVGCGGDRPFICEATP